MKITVSGVGVKINFGIGFLRELDEKYYITNKQGIKFGASMDYKIPMLLGGDTVTLSDILYAGTHAEEARPKQAEIDAYIDEVKDIDKLFEEVVSELKKSNATKKQTTRMVENIEKAEEEAAELEKLIEEQKKAQEKPTNES